MLERLHDSHDLLGAVPTIERGQLGGVGGDEARGDAAPVAAANDRHPVFGVPVVHLRRGSGGQAIDRANQGQEEQGWRTSKRNKRVCVYIIYDGDWGPGRRGECPSVWIASLDRTARRGTPRIACVCFQQGDSGCHFVLGIQEGRRAAAAGWLQALAGAEDSSICFSVVSKAGQALLWPARPAKPKEGPNHFTSLSGCPSKSCLIPSQLGIRKSVFAYLSGVLSVAVSKKKK